MIITTSENISGKNYEMLNLVKGTVVCSRNLAKDIKSVLKATIGGEIKPFTELSNHSLDIATSRMIEAAKTMNADAIISTRYETCVLMSGTIQFIVYGTAVKII